MEKKESPNKNNIHINEGNQKNLDIQNNDKERENNLDELSNIIKEIPLNNLNDYYDIETNFFKKRIEKLNLKFYWIYESELGGENIKTLLYPYNKLFLILFKEISLYIEEILRLNKQLCLKNKNEKYYIQKINDYKTKEKDYLSNKQIIKNLERNIKKLEKNNEKLKNDIEKKNRKLFSPNVPKYSNKNFGMWKHNKSRNEIFKVDNKTTKSKIYSGITTEQASVMSYGSNQNTNRAHNNKTNISKELIGCANSNRINSNSSINTKTTNFSSGNNVKDIALLGINQCEDEIKNLNMIENMIMKYYDNINKKKSSFKRKNVIYKKLSPTNITKNDIDYTIYKRNTNYHKKLVKNNKSLDYKTVTINNTNRI